jgi:flagellar protein FlgJ
MQLWVIESDNDARRLAIDSDTILGNDAFKNLLSATKTALQLAKPLVGEIISVGEVVLQLLRKKLQTNKDDLVGYWQTTLNRQEHYPYGIRNRQDVADTTGNMLIDYTLFGFKNEVLTPFSITGNANQSGNRQDNTPDDSAPENNGSSVPVNLPEDNLQIFSAPLNASFSPWRGAEGEEEFIRQIYPAAQYLYENRDGLHPLFVTAQAALETGWKIKAPGNNIFGITKGASWSGKVNLLPTIEIFNTPDKTFTPPERIVSVEQISPDKYRYRVYRQFRAYDSPENSLEDHLALLRGKLYDKAWQYRHDPREYARRIAGTYASNPDYAKTLIAVMDKIEKTMSQ